MHKPTLFNKAFVDGIKLPKPPVGWANALKVYGNPGNGKRPHPTWVNMNLTRVQLPYPMKLAWDKGTIVTSMLVHDFAIDLVYILKDIQLNARLIVKKRLLDAGKPLPSTAEIDKLVEQELSKLGLDLFGGTYNHRLKRGGSSLSTHAFGCAIDLDPARNGMGNRKYTMPEWVIQIFEGYGWTSGARWKSPDAMHFQRGSF